MKPWIAKLRHHVVEWNERLPKDLARYVYRFDPIDNVAKILNAGELLSRAECARREVRYTDCASSEVIVNTQAAHKDFVRLYFYPLTPTQYHTEGIRPASNYSNHRAHCAVPVFMMFDFVDLLARDETQFSTGNMASGGVEFGATEADFDKIPFEWVYHRGSVLNHPQPRNIIFHRHAEVLVPVALPTAEIKRIVCRSYPERRTLLHLLRPDVRVRFENLVQVEAGNFFEREWAFVEKVEPGNAVLTFSFNPPRASSLLDVEFKYQDAERLWSWKQAWDLKKNLRMRLAEALPVGTAMLWIEGHLAFQDKVNLSESPL